MESMETIASPTEALIEQAFEHGMIQVREEVTALVDLLRSRQPIRNVMEIGSESGGTFYLWCRLATLGGLKISLDKPDGESGSWRYVDPVMLEARMNEFKSWSANVRVVTGDSHSPEIKQQIAKILGNEKLDFLFIDGDHSYEGVKADWEMYREFVRSGGLIAFHDINHLGPAQLWPEIDSPKMEFNSHQHWAGIGVVTV
jgi:cephalosporin hydroxylase